MKKTLLLILLTLLLCIAPFSAAGTNTALSAAQEENPTPIVELVQRIGGTQAADHFLFVLDPSLNTEHEAFVIGAKNGKVCIKGSTMSALTTGLGWYLHHYAHINIAWNALNEKSEGEAYADLSHLPLPTKEETRTCDAPYRYFLNYCTFGYSMTTWTWKRWQQEIDWMALHGINMPLQIVGMEEVWRKFLTLEENGKRKYGYSDSEAKAFVAGPAFTAWWGMNNLEGWGGTAPGSLNGKTWEGAGGVQDDAWYVRQQALAAKIVGRQRDLGMQPVLPGFSGMVPTNFTTKTSVPTDANGGKWAGGFQRPRIIDPTYRGFADIAADYYKCLHEVMGQSQFYSMDPFHEGGAISSGKYTEAYKAIYDAMEAAMSGSQWVIQQWQWDGNQRHSITAVPAGRLIVLDLFSDGKPAFDTYNGYAPQEAVFCAIPNFGGRSGLMGRLNNLTQNYFTYKAKYATIKGIGAAPEAIEQTPVTYDLLFQLPWMNQQPDMAAWIKSYATARYGTENAVAQQAWDLLRQGVLNYGADGIQGPVEDVWAARPNLEARPASTWGKTLNHAGGIYTKTRRQMLIDATYKLLSQSELLKPEKGSVHESNYLYDIVELGGGVMADYAYDLLLGIKTAKDAAGSRFAQDATYKARRDAFLALIADVDAFKGSNLNFRLGKWTQEARDAAAEVKGAVDATPDWYELNNARTLITTWSSPNTNLNDYSYRSWQGLLKDFYLPRWKYFFDHNCTNTEYGYFEWNWAHGRKHAVGQTTVNNTRLKEGEAGYSYSREPEGNTIELATELLNKYLLPISVNGEKYYAYRYLDNDFTAQVTIVAQGGTTIDLTPYFGKLNDAKVKGDFMDGEATDLSKIKVKEDAANGAHTGTLTLADGTVLTFAVVLNPEYYGAYRIRYGKGAVFMGYNTDHDNSRNEGYKLLDPNGKYRAAADADEIVTIRPMGEGFSLSIQGKHLQSPTLNGWNHVLFTDDSNNAGSYLFEQTATPDIYKIRSTGEGINYLNDYGNVFGNDKHDKPNLSTFAFEQVDHYLLSVSEAGIAALCLPFQVVMPEGVTAYDLTSDNIVANADDDTKATATLKQLATAGNTLRQGTPVVLKATPGLHRLPIVMSAADAHGAAPGSLLRGTFVRQTLQQSNTATKFLPEAGNAEAVLQRMPSNSTLAANTCWVEWQMPEELANVSTITLQFDTSTNIVALPSHTTPTRIYDTTGRPLPQMQKGINIVDGEKIYMP